MTWLMLDTTLISNGVWSDGLASRLWIWMLCTAKRNARAEGTVRFSFPVAAKQLAYRDGNRWRMPSRKALRRALRRLQSDGRLTVREWVQGPDYARARGGAQGYLHVDVTNWAIYQDGKRDSGTEPNGSNGTGLDRERPAKGGDST